MGDMRFVLVGVGLVFAGFITLGMFGDRYHAASLEADEFGTCFEYSDASPPKEINCSFKAWDQGIFFGLVLGLIGGGVAALIRGARGNWDSKVRPEDMAGPSSHD